MDIKYGSITEINEDKDDENEEEDEIDNEDNIQETNNDKWVNCKLTLLGISLSLISGVLFTVNNFIINQFQVVVSDAVLVRCIIQIIIFNTIIFYSRDSLLPANSKMKILTLSQGLFGAINFITSLASVSFMPVPDALCIIFTCPVVTIVLSAIMLGDKLNSLKCFSGAFLLLGVVLVCKPPFFFHPTATPDNLLDIHDSLYYVGVALASTAFLTGGLMDVTIAKCEGVSTPVLVNWTAMIGLVISISYSLLQSSSCILSPDIHLISLSDWLILTGLAVSGLLAFTSRAQALKHISPNLVSSIRALELVLAFIVQTLISTANPDVWSCLGGVLVFSGVLILTFQKKIYEMFCKELPLANNSQTSSSQLAQQEETA